MFVLSLSYLITQSDKSFSKAKLYKMLAKKWQKMPRRPRNRYIGGNCPASIVRKNKSIFRNTTQFLRNTFKMGVFGAQWSENAESSNFFREKISENWVSGQFVSRLSYTVYVCTCVFVFNNLSYSYNSPNTVL